MNLDELRSVQSRERQAASLQNLRATFYEDAGAFIQQLQEERDRAAERAEDPFASPEVRKLTDDIETARGTVEAIYERRVGKVVKMASIAAADMPSAEENLTTEERELFDTLVDHIKDNREDVLGRVLKGEGSDLSCARELATSASAADARTDSAAETEQSADAEETPEPPGEESPSTDVSAADVMSGDDSEPDADDADARPVSPGDAPPGDPNADTAAESVGPQSDTAQSDADDPSGETGSTETDDALERTTVRLTTDVGEILGADERAYDLSADDVVTLPAANAGPLVDKGAAERLD